MPAGFPVEVERRSGARRPRRVRCSPPGVPARRARDARDLAARHHRPGRQPRPRPGVPRRTHGRAATACTTRSPTSPRSSCPAAPLDREAFVRGVTLYLPDGRAPMLPDVLGEGAASLLPDGRPSRAALDLRPRRRRRDPSRPAANGRPCAAARRARLRRRAGRRSTAATPRPSLALLRELGEHLLDRERDRGGVSIAAPGQEVVRDAAGCVLARVRGAAPGRDVERADLAAHRDAKRRGSWWRAASGIVRTLPPPDAGIVARLRRTARALGHRLARRARRTPTSCAGSARPTRARATFLIQALARAARRRLRGRRRPTSPRARARRRSGRRTRTSPRRCGGSPTATPTRWCSRSRRLPHRRRGRSTRSLVSSTSCREPIGTRVRSTARASTRSRPRCSPTTSVTTFPATVVDRHGRGVVVLLAEVPVVATVPGDRALGDAVTVRLEALDPVARTLAFSLLPR